MKDIIIYHGSKEIVYKPAFKFANFENDFGEGFYCTKDIEIAKEWACKENTDGFINEYKFNTNELKVLNLLDDEFSILNWISILTHYRVFHKKNSFKTDVKQFLKKYYINIEKYDVINAYRCDDSFFKYTRDFLNNKLSLKQLEEALKLGNLGKQIVIKSKKAFDCLEFVKADEVFKSEYYLRFYIRDLKARKKYEKLINKKTNIEDMYIMDLLRMENKNESI